MKEEIKKKALDSSYIEWKQFCYQNKLPRKKIYDALIELRNDECTNETEFNEIDSIVSCLEGSCSAACVDKYYGDPDDQYEIVNFARSRKWLEQDYYTS
jgi:hypothetical protein